MVVIAEFVRYFNILKNTYQKFLDLPKKKKASLVVMILSLLVLIITTELLVKLGPNSPEAIRIEMIWNVSLAFFSTSAGVLSFIIYKEK